MKLGLLQLFPLFLLIILLSIEYKERRQIKLLDTGNSFLEAPMKGDEICTIR